jgi:nucleotide-binding universal stress UspA family protein
MFRKILFPTDLSEYSNAAMQCLPELKTIGLEHAVLLHVINPVWLAANGGGAYNLKAHMQQDVRQILENAQADLIRQGVETDVVIETGPPAQVILDLAENFNVDLIVMSAHGRSRLAQFLLGSNVEKVLRESQRPVLVQRFETLEKLDPEECRQLCSQTFQRLLYPTDFSKSARIAYETIRELSSQITEVVVVHIQDERTMRHRPAEQLAEFDRIDQQRLNDICSSFESAGISARARLDHGIPFERITALAREEKVSSIIMGSRGRTTMSELLLGSNAENVVRRSSVPVLVTHSRRFP